MRAIRKYGDIVNKQFTVNRRRNLLTILGIILSIILFTSVGYIQNYSRDLNILEIKSNGGDYEAVFKDISEEQLKMLTNNVNVRSVGSYSEIYSERVNINGIEKNINIYSLDRVALQEIFSPIIKLESGNIPKEEGEIILDEVGKNLLNNKIGDLITFEEKEYKITGFFDKNSPFNSYSIEGITYSEGENTNAIFNTIHTDRDEIYKIADNLEIKRNNVFTNEMLFYSYGEGNNYKIVEASLYIVILILTIFLTYGSINVSVKERVNQFSILRCIGATPNKLRRMLIKESCFLLILSIIPGIILGQLVCFFISDIVLTKFIGMKNYGLGYKVYPNVLIMVIILTVINIVVSTIVPVVNIGKLSPIEGVKGIANIKRRNHNIITRLFGYNGEIAYKNIRADNKNFIITTVVSIIILTIFIVFSAYNENLITVNSSEYTKDIALDITPKSENVSDEILYHKNQISQLGVAEKIYSRVDYSADGIFKGVKLNKYIPEIKREDGYGEKRVNFQGKQSTYSNMIRILVSDDNILEEMLPYVDEQLSLEDFKDNGVVVINRVVIKNFIDVCRENLFDLNFEDKFTLAIKDINDGIRIPVSEDIDYIMKNNREIEFKYLGSIDGDKLLEGKRYGYSNSITLIVSEDFINREGLKLNEINLMIDTTDDDRSIGIIKEYSNVIDGYYFENYDWKYYIGNYYLMMGIVVYIILLLTIIVGAINIINNKTINITLRSKEIGVFLAIGMTKKRLRKILMLEGIIQWIIASAISLGLSFVILKIINEIIYYTSEVEITNMPIEAMLFGVSVLLIINILASYLPIRKLKTMDTTKLIRNNE